MARILRDVPQSKPARILLICWLAATLICIGLGIYQVSMGWNGIPVQFGPIRFSMTIYPPLVICLWMVFWLGFEWAFLAAYLATWTLSLYVGMPLKSATMFALVDPLALAVYALAYRTARIPFDLHRPKSGLWFIVVSFVAAVAGSTGSFIWSEARGLSAAEALAIWQGWWIGALAQALVVNAPVLAILSRRLERLKWRYFQPPSMAEPTLRWIATAIAAGGLVLAGFLVASSELASVRLSQALATNVSADARRAIVDASYSWKLTAWAGMALTLAGSLGGIFLAYAWNRTLFREVRARTAEFQESEHRFRQTFEQAAVGIAHVGLDGHWLRVNQKLCDIVGYTREELLRRTFQEITYTEDLDADLTNVRRVLTGEITTYAMEKRYIRKDGSLIWIQLTVSVARGMKNEPQYFISIVEDIDERKRLEEQLRQSQKMEAIGRLAGGVAHDFNNLLTVINGYSDLLLHQLPADDPRRSPAEEIHKAGGRAAELTSQLLAFGRKQVGRPRPINLNSIIEESDKMLRRLLGEDIQTSTRLYPGIGMVMADPGHIHQVLMNLAVNARDAMPSGGTLTIETAAERIERFPGASESKAKSGPAVRLTVSDTGTGMGDDTLKNIFEPFFTTKGNHGTGLGLATVYGIIQQCGGCIAVSSSPDRGSSFRVYLPCVEGVPQPAGGVSRAATRVDSVATVLVVEDQDEVRRFAVRALVECGCRVLAAADGREAIAMAAGHSGRIDILLTDVVLPGMNGREVADCMVQARPGIKVIYTSGYTQDLIANRGVLYSDVMYLPKPYTTEQVAAKVREALQTS